MSYEIPLVAEIEKRPCLYNSSLPEYNRKDVLEAAWVEVSSVVNLTVYECKDKWKNIRSSFVRSLRMSGGKSKRPYYLTKYLQFLIPYLKPVGADFNMVDIPDTSNDSQSQTAMEVHDDFSNALTIKVESEFESERITDPLTSLPFEIEKPAPSASSVCLLKRRRHMPMKNYAAAYQRNKNKRLHTSHIPPRTENNGMKYFLLSLLPELDTMDEDQVRLFKIKVMMLIDDIKTDSAKVKADFPNTRENTRLQKRLINLLLKNLEH